MNVLLTRPLEQAGSLKRAILTAGHNPILFPALTIQPQKAKPQQPNYDVIIFISVNAVRHGLDLLKKVAHQQVKIFAIGAATAKKLVDNNIKVDGFPQRNSSSSALLAMEEFCQLRNSKVLIFKGKGGVEILKKTLLKQDNIVEHVEVYQRQQCEIIDLHIQSLSQFLASDTGMIVITSVEGLYAMVAIIKSIRQNAVAIIKNYLLVVLSTRIKTNADAMGFQQVKVAQQTTIDSVVRAIKG